MWPFVLQFLSFPFALVSVSLLMGALINEVVNGDLEAYLFFTVSSFGEVDFIDLETRVLFPSLGVLILGKPILLTSRH